MDAPEFFEIGEQFAAYRPAGRITLEQGVRMVTSAIAYAREQNIHKLLVDTTGVTGFPPPGMGARYYFAQEWANAAGGFLRVAFVARPEMIDPQKFAMTVAANRGMAADVFVSEEEATAWLLGVE